MYMDEAKARGYQLSRDVSYPTVIQREPTGTQEIEPPAGKHTRQTVVVERINNRLVLASLVYHQEPPDIKGAQLDANPA